MRSNNDLKTKLCKLFYYITQIIIKDLTKDKVIGHVKWLLFNVCSKYYPVILLLFVILMSYLFQNIKRKYNASMMKKIIVNWFHSIFNIYFICYMMHAQITKHINCLLFPGVIGFENDTLVHSKLNCNH